MIISVVTVVLDNKEGLSKTALSVLQQSSKNYEYLIVDGGSTDGTQEYINKILKNFNSVKVKCTFISERDNGPYDAMNKGASAATGDYLLFLNAGDTFFDNGVIDDYLSYITNNDYPDVLYASAQVIDYDMYKIIKPSPISTIRTRMPFCHQSSIIRRVLFNSFMFDTSYTISADYLLFLKCYEMGCSFYECDFVGSVFAFGGISSDINLLETETRRARNECGIFQNERAISKRSLFNNRIKSIIPKSILKILMRLKGWKKL